MSQLSTRVQSLVTANFTLGAERAGMRICLTPTCGSARGMWFLLQQTSCLYVALNGRDAIDSIESRRAIAEPYAASIDPSSVAFLSVSEQRMGNANQIDLQGKHVFEYRRHDVMRTFRTDVARGGAQCGHNDPCGPLSVDLLQALETIADGGSSLTVSSSNFIGRVSSS